MIPIGSVSLYLPEGGATPDGLWLPVALDVARFGRVVQDEGEGEEPAKVKEREEGCLVLPFRELSVNEVGNSFLHGRKPGRDLLNLGRNGAFGPSGHCASPLPNAHWHPVVVEGLGRLA